MNGIELTETFGYLTKEEQKKYANVLEDLYQELVTKNMTITRDRVFLMIAKILTSDDYIERADIAVAELESFGVKVAKG